MNASIAWLETITNLWWEYIVHASWQSGSIGLALLGWVWIGRNWNAKLRYALLIVALLKFAVPPTLSFPTGAFSWTGPALSAWASGALTSDRTQTNQTEQLFVGTTTAGESTDYLETNVNAKNDENSFVPWRTFLMGVHGLGAISVCLWFAYQYRFVRSLRRRSVLVRHGTNVRTLDDWRNRLGVRKTIRLYLSPGDVSPLSYGLWRPSIFIPASLQQKASPLEQEAILAHETAHVARGDIRTNYLQLLLFAVWWFHPVYWILNREIRKVREDCCDDLILRQPSLTPGEYCNALIQISSTLPQNAAALFALGFSERLHSLSRRIHRIMDERIQRRVRYRSLQIALTIGLALVVLPGFSSDESEPPNQTQKHTLEEIKEHKAHGGKVVILDPGHGGIDSGAKIRGVDAVEKDLVLDVAWKVKERLERDPRIWVVMTRYGDYLPVPPDFTSEDKRVLKHESLRYRVRLAKENQGDLYMSLHLNCPPRSAGYERNEGFEIYCPRIQPSLLSENGEPAVTQETASQSRSLAEKIVEKIDAVPWMKLRDPTIKTQRFTVFRETNIPSVLIELLYLSNPREREIVQDEKKREVLAEAVSQGVIGYLD